MELSIRVIIRHVQRLEWETFGSRCSMVLFRRFLIFDMFLHFEKSLTLGKFCKQGLQFVGEKDHLKVCQEYLVLMKGEQVGCSTLNFSILWSSSVWSVERYPLDVLVSFQKVLEGFRRVWARIRNFRKNLKIEVFASGSGPWGESPDLPRAIWDPSFGVRTFWKKSGLFLRSWWGPFGVRPFSGRRFVPFWFG